MNYTTIKTYGKKPLYLRLLQRKKNYLNLTLPNSSKELRKRLFLNF